MAAEYEALPGGPLRTNCYVVWDSSTRAAALIDPGGEIGDVEELVARQRLDVKWVLLTHGHPDHTFAATQLAERFAARTGMHSGDLPQLEETAEVGKMFYGTSDFPAFNPTDLLHDGQVIALGESEIRVLHTPGHSPGGVCFVADVGVFCGDTIFDGSIGRTDLPGGSYDQIISSIREKLLTMDDATPLYPGHGGPTTVGKERRANPYLQ